MIRKFHWLSVALSFAILFAACTSIDLYEKTATIPGHAWKSSYTPSFSFQIKDSSSPYRVFLVLRHSDKYRYNNIYINLHALQPGNDSARTIRYDLPLGNNEQGWLAGGMDDIYEHRISLTPPGQEFYFKKTGEYTFRIEQIMREDPLEHVLNVGLRLEKVQ